MGVSCVIPWDPPEGYDANSAIESLQKRSEILGAKPCGSYAVDYESYQSSQHVANPAQMVHILHCTEYPYSTFAVMDSGSCLVADISFDIIMSHLKVLYAPRKGQKFEARGYKYEADRYIIKFGIVSNHRRIIVEVEDKQAVSMAESWESLTQFVGGFLHRSQPIPLPMIATTASPAAKEQAAVDSMVQYARIFGQLKKAA